MKPLLSVALALVVLACSRAGASSPPASAPASAPASVPASGPASASESFGPRPSSPATLTITQPADGATVSGTTVHVSLNLENATITSLTTASIRPDQGHIHLYFDGVLTTMNYSTEQDLPVTPGTYSLKAEFVAADHAPFSPRVWSNQVVFTVK
ncbi:MAG TPA: hypothetical protein VIK08_05155 [Candidatus Limnocylindrales bacterium]